MAQIQPFKRLRIDNVISGGTRIWWELNPHFVDPGPYTFQLQVGHTGLRDADDWKNVGTPVVDTYMAFDLDQRVFGKTLDVHYRVVLNTTAGIYISNAQDCDGLLSKHDWITWREMLRKEMLRHRAQTSVRGFLLKARRYGPRCKDCTDSLTEEITRTQCPTCYGTGFELGYFTPLDAYYADVGMESNREHRNPSKGMDKEDAVTARFLGDPQLYSYDVWCNGTSDERYYIHTVGIKAQVRGVPVVLEAELKLAPYTDVIYTFPLPTWPTILLDKTNSKKGTAITQKDTLWQNPAQPRPMKPGLSYLDAALAELKERRNRSSRR